MNKCLSQQREPDEHFTNISAGPPERWARVTRVGGTGGEAQYAGLTVGERCAVYGDEGLLVLSQHELQLLRALVSAQGEPISRDRLLEAGWGGRGGRPHRVNVALSRLREKLAGTDITIQVVRGVGYRLASERRARSSVRARTAPEILVVSAELGIARDLQQCLPRLRVHYTSGLIESIDTIERRPIVAAVVDARAVARELPLVEAIRQRAAALPVLLISTVLDRGLINAAAARGIFVAIAPYPSDVVLGFVDAVAQATGATLSANSSDERWPTQRSLVSFD